MNKSFKNKLSLSAVILITVIGVLIFINPVFALDFNIRFNPQVGIPYSNFTPGNTHPVSGTTFGEYIVAYHKWIVSAIIVLGAVMIVVGGFQWMLAGGSVPRIGQAKARILSALVGIVLAVGSYTILNFINPMLVRFPDFEAYIGEMGRASSGIPEMACHNDLLEYNFAQGGYCITGGELEEGGNCDTIEIVMPPGSFPFSSKRDICEVSIFLGVDDNDENACLEQQENGSFETEIDTTEWVILSSENNWTGGIGDDSPNEDYTRYSCNIGEGGSKLVVRACYGNTTACQSISTYSPSGSDELKGFTFLTFDLSMWSGASAGFANVRVYTNIGCPGTCNNGAVCTMGGNCADGSNCNPSDLMSSGGYQDDGWYCTGSGESVYKWKMLNSSTLPSDQHWSFDWPSDYPTCDYTNYNHSCACASNLHHVINTPAALSSIKYEEIANIYIDLYVSDGDYDVDELIGEVGDDASASLNAILGGNIKAYVRNDSSGLTNFDCSASYGATEIKARACFSNTDCTVDNIANYNPGNDDKLEGVNVIYDNGGPGGATFGASDVHVFTRIKCTADDDGNIVEILDPAVDGYGICQ